MTAGPADQAQDAVAPEQDAVAAERATVGTEPDSVGTEQDGIPGPPERRPRADPEDWRWVREIRSSGEPTPWAPGVALLLFSALLVGVAIFVLSSGLADVPLMAVLINLVVAGGLAPAVWLTRTLPVLRWVAGGVALGIVVGWFAALIFLA
ncbi:DUF2537 domain-containing protein [Nakamurella sp. YIM 132087]|uniref:DUF2537 domain-containing protein n=1 Tax=Nakamurella alba TaxID=2665158 RepID=A0A7K1FUF4_9ACTN|nr:DUF2537 domain-containing protein [Nakamurella alba]MTD16979.1 DUF2537 domain-containing protein [Nakamurella alba]